MNNQNNLAKILEEANHFTLQGIRLAESHLKLGLTRKGPLPNQASQAFHLEFIAEANTPVIQVAARFKLHVRHGNEKNGEPAIQVAATFLLSFLAAKIPGQAAHPENTLEKVALLNVWPYWREYVQSTTVRMGLPAFPMPLLTSNEMKIERAKPLA
jgi:hypothetical protein